MGGCIEKKNNVVINRISNKTNYYDELREEKNKKHKLKEKGSEKSNILLSDICKDLKITVIQVDNDDINNTESFREILKCLN